MPTVIGYQHVKAQDVPVGCMFKRYSRGEEDGLFLRIFPNLTTLDKGKEVAALIIEPLEKIAGGAVEAMRITPFPADEMVLLITEWEVV